MADGGLMAVGDVTPCPEGSARAGARLEGPGGDVRLSEHHCVGWRPDPMASAAVCPGWNGNLAKQVLEHVDEVSHGGGQVDVGGLKGRDTQAKTFYNF